MKTFHVWWQGKSLAMVSKIDIEAPDAQEAFLKLFDAGGFWDPFRRELPRWIPFTAILEVAGPVGTVNAKPKSRKRNAGGKKE